MTFLQLEHLKLRIKFVYLFAIISFIFLRTWTPVDLLRSKKKKIVLFLIDCSYNPKSSWSVELQYLIYWHMQFDYKYVTLLKSMSMYITFTEYFPRLLFLAKLKSFWCLWFTNGNTITATVFAHVPDTSVWLLLKLWPHQPCEASQNSWMSFASPSSESAVILCTFSV